MRTEPRPTRAEVSDAANAVDDRVDAIMLAGETAAGRLSRARRADAGPRDSRRGSDSRRHGGSARALAVCSPEHGRAICEAAVTLVDRSDASAIVAITRGGKTARVLSALRPRVPIFAVTDRPPIAHRLALAWGVVPVLADLSGDVNAAASRIGEDLVARGAIPASSALVLVSVTPDLAPRPVEFPEAAARLIRHALRGRQGILTPRHRGTSQTGTLTDAIGCAGARGVQRVGDARWSLGRPRPRGECDAGRSARPEVSWDGLDRIRGHRH